MFRSPRGREAVWGLVARDHVENRDRVSWESENRSRRRDWSFDVCRRRAGRGGAGGARLRCRWGCLLGTRGGGSLKNGHIYIKSSLNFTTKNPHQVQYNSVSAAASKSSNVARQTLQIQRSASSWAQGQAKLLEFAYSWGLWRRDWWSWAMHGGSKNGILLVIVRISLRIPVTTHLLLRQRMLNGKAEVRDECRLVEQRWELARQELRL